MGVLRELEGVSYWVIEDPSEIAEFVTINIRKEWEYDYQQNKSQAGKDWLDGLPKRSWVLSAMPLDQIRLDQETMDYVNPTLEYNFRKRLVERKDEMRRAMDKFGVVISPLIIKKEDNTLIDGYCRYHVLVDKNVQKTFAYVGKQ